MRLFVAIEFDRQTRNVLQQVQRRLSHRCENVNWTADEHLHMTTKFLGEVKDDRMQALSDVVSTAASRSECFDLQVGQCGCFPKRGEARIVWVGGQEKTGLLARCVETLEALVVELGFKRESRPFSPHITIGRVRNDRSERSLRDAVDGFSFEPVVQPVASLTLMSSVLSRQGPTYTRVCSAKFA